MEFQGTQRFEVIRRLGAGGMGVVYEATDTDRQVRVALKTLRYLAPEAVVSFKHEFRSLRGLQHPNLVHLGELVEDNGLWFFTMDLVEGVDFSEWVRRVGPHPSLGLGTGSHPPALADTVRAGRDWRDDSYFDEERLRSGLGQLAQGLHAIHGAGKVHRDVKPSNVRATADGRIVLLDFGLVEEVGSRHSQDSFVVGSVPYMAPEQSTLR